MVVFVFLTFIFNSFIMFFFFVKLLIFTVGYSFIMGALMFIPALLIMGSLKDTPGQRSPIATFLGLAMGGFLILGQAFIISRAADITLATDPSRSSFWWYLIAFFFCVPYALLKDKKNDDISSLGVLLGIILYLVGVFTNIDNIGIVNKIAKYISV